MPNHLPAPSPNRPPVDSSEVPFAANDVRLSPRGWAVATLLIAGAFWGIPATWSKIEPLDIGPDHRVPYALGNDYWNFERTCREVCRGDAILLVGDSVVWGHYVESDETLSHYLDDALGRRRVANLGVDGIHPVAMAGLIEHYGGAIRDKRVIINFNPLWITSPRHDLSLDKEFAFNHPGLAPQFARIPCYRATLSERLGIVVARNVGFFGWADHVRIAYFEGDDLASWTLEHPYDNPAGAVTLRLPSPDEPPSPAPDARAWTAKGIRKTSPEWVALDDSLQWQFFRRSVALLEDRGNRVFVLVGPFNEHMLTDEGLQGYARRRERVASWLAGRGIAHYAAPALPSETYADLSHPTAEGYRILARRLLDQEAFQAFLPDNPRTP